MEMRKTLKLSNKNRKISHQAEGEEVPAANNNWTMSTTTTSLMTSTPNDSDATLVTQRPASKSVKLKERQRRAPHVMPFFALSVFLSVMLAILPAARLVDCAKLETQIKLLINDDDLLLQEQPKHTLEWQASGGGGGGGGSYDGGRHTAATDLQHDGGGTATTNEHNFNLYRSELKRLSYETIHRILRDENEPNYRREDVMAMRNYQKRSYAVPSHELVRRSVAASEQPLGFLNMSHANLSEFSANTQGMHDKANFITTLDLSGNQLKSLNFSGFPRLQNINAADNRLSELPVFERNTVLALNLNGNRIGSGNAPTDFYLHELHLSSNQIRSLSTLNLSLLNALETLDLSCNRIETIETTFFPQRMRNLRHLNLAGNNLGTIYREAFYNLLSLNTLLLTHNNITDIDYETFLALPNLQFLDLSFNRLKGESIRALQGIPDLIGLSIAYNPHVGASMQEFVASWSLKELDASGTGLCQIPAALAQSVRTLKLTDNWLKIINCGDLDSYPLLQHLDLSHSRIEDIEDDALGRLEILEVLFLDHNRLRRVPLSLPTSLEHLFLQSNQIMDIPELAFLGLRNLRTLDLSGNRLILYLPALPLPRLLTLNLQSAGVKGVSQAIVHTLPSLRDLLLDDNPIKCSDLLGIAEWASPCRLPPERVTVGVGVAVGGQHDDDDDDEDPDNIDAQEQRPLQATSGGVQQQQQQVAAAAASGKIDLKAKFVQMHNFFEKFKKRCGTPRPAAEEVAPPACAVELDDGGNATTTTPVPRPTTKTTTTTTFRSTTGNGNVQALPASQQQGAASRPPPLQQEQLFGGAQQQQQQQPGPPPAPPQQEQHLKMPSKKNAQVASASELATSAPITPFAERASGSPPLQPRDEGGMPVPVQFGSGSARTAKMLPKFNSAPKPNATMAATTTTTTTTKVATPTAPAAELPATGTAATLAVQWQQQPITEMPLQILTARGATTTTRRPSPAGQTSERASAMAGQEAGEGRLLAVTRNAYAPTATTTTVTTTTPKQPAINSAAKQPTTSAAARQSKETSAASNNNTNKVAGGEAQLKVTGVAAQGAPLNASKDSVKLVNEHAKIATAFGAHAAATTATEAAASVPRPSAKALSTSPAPGREGPADEAREAHETNNKANIPAHPTAPPPAHKHEPLQILLKDRHLIGTPLLMHASQNLLVESSEHHRPTPLTSVSLASAAEEDTTKAAASRGATASQVNGAQSETATKAVKATATTKTTTTTTTKTTTPPTEAPIRTTSTNEPTGRGNNSQSRPPAIVPPTASGLTTPTPTPTSTPPPRMALANQGMDASTARWLAELFGTSDKRQPEAVNATTARGGGDKQASNTNQGSTTPPPPTANGRAASMHQQQMGGVGGGATTHNASPPPTKHAKKPHHDEMKKKPSLTMKKMTITTKHTAATVSAAANGGGMQQQHHTTTHNHHSLNVPRENEATIERHHLFKELKPAQAGNKQQTEAPPTQQDWRAETNAVQSSRPTMTKTPATTTTTTTMLGHGKHSAVNTPVNGGQRPRELSTFAQMHQQMQLQHLDEVDQHASPPSQAKEEPRTSSSTSTTHRHQQQQQHGVISHQPAQWLDVRTAATTSGHPGLVILLSFALFVVLLVGLMHVYRCDMPWRRHFSAPPQLRPHQRRHFNDDDAHSFLHYQQSGGGGGGGIQRWHHSARRQPPYSSPLHSLHVRELQKTSAVDEKINRSWKFSSGAATASGVSATCRSNDSSSSSGSSNSSSRSSSAQSSAAASLNAIDEAFYIEANTNVATASTGQAMVSAPAHCDLLPMELLNVKASRCARQPVEGAAEMQTTRAGCDQAWTRSNPNAHDESNNNNGSRSGSGGRDVDIALKDINTSARIMANAGTVDAPTADTSSSSSSSSTRKFGLW